MSKTNLLYLVPSLSNPGGMERILTEKMNYLSNNGQFNVHVISTESSEKSSYFDISPTIRHVNLGLNFNQFFELNIFFKYYFTKKTLKQYQSIIEEYIQSNDIHVCISLGGKELEFLHKLNVSCKKMCELHFGQEIREQFLAARSNSFLWKLLGQYRTRELIRQTKALDKLVVLTKADELVWKKTNNNVVQIYNFSALEPSTSASLDHKRAIAIGRLDAQKGFDLLLSAWQSVAKQRPDWRLDIFGTGEWRQSLNAQIGDYNLSSVVTIHDVTNDVQKELLNSSLFILSSRYEGFPMVLLESISCGVPIVSFNCKTGPSEIIVNDDCGYLVPAENVEELAASIISGISNMETLKIKGKVAKQKSGEFSKEKIMQQWIYTFKELRSL